VRRFTIGDIGDIGDWRVAISAFPLSAFRFPLSAFPTLSSPLGVPRGEVATRRMG